MHSLTCTIIAFILMALLILVLAIRSYMNGPESALNSDMSGKTVIVTGSNAGIGKVTAIELLKRGAKVIFASRDEAKTNAVINSIKEKQLKDRAHFIQLDLSSFESITSFAEEFKLKHKNLDILINNAGAAFDRFKLIENIEATLMTNHIGPVCLTAMLIDFINPRGKVINVSSRRHKHASEKTLAYLYQEPDFSNLKNDYRTTNLYALSKLGSVYHAKSLNEFFQRNHKDIRTASIHPGVVNTEIFSSKRFSRLVFKCLLWLLYPLIWLLTKNAYVGAQTTLHVAYLPYEDLNSGAYFNNCKEERLGRLGSNKEKCEEFMNFTHQLIKKNWKLLPQEIINYFKC